MSLSEKKPMHNSAKWWLQAMLNQVYEASEDCEHNNFAHMEKEVADIAAVALDCIRIMYGHDAFFVMNTRLAENLSKHVDERPADYYVQKTIAIRGRIGDICPGEHRCPHGECGRCEGCR